MLINPHIANTLSAIEAVSLRSSGLSWQGIRLRPHLPEGAITRSIMAELLSSLLYQQFYCYGHVVPLPSEPPRKIPLTRRTIDRLVAANRLRSRWEGGWRIISKDGEYLDAERGGLRALVSPGWWRPAQRGQVDVRFASGSFALSPGFYLVTAGGSFKEPDVVRIYWNVAVGGESRLISALDSSLGHRRMPYRVKVLTESSRAERADACVLYLQRSDFQEAGACLVRVYRTISKFVRRAVPAYSLQIADGLSVAEQPPGEESFGQHRCRILAEGMIVAAEAGSRSPKERMAKVAEHFSRSGYSLERPHLNPGSAFDYKLPIQVTSHTSGPRRKKLFNGRDPFLEPAVQIGEELVRRAVWYSGRCNWVGNRTGPGPAFGSLGPDLYSGTSGIGWFLAELFRVSAKEEFRRTAVRGIRQAWESCETWPLTLNKGLYAGWTGIAYAAWRCSFLLDLPQLHARVRKTLARLNGIPADCEAPDLISGEAGAILGLLVLGDEAALTLAHVYGSALVRKARRSREGWSWKTTGWRTRPHLTGLAHGTSGIAAALMSLYARTGDAAFCEAARGALNYERAYFNKVRGNWPDFRGVGSRREPRQYACAWCHGAPGIALSRRLAVTVLKSACDLSTELRIALETTRSAVAKGLIGEQDFCLCHGLAGNADILSLAGHESDQELVRQVGHLGLEQFGKRVYREEPTEALLGLMAGIAGIGHFYLRLHDPSVPSPLWIGPGLESNSEIARQ